MLRIKMFHNLVALVISKFLCTQVLCGWIVTETFHYWMRLDKCLDFNFKSRLHISSAPFI